MAHDYDLTNEQTGTRTRGRKKKMIAHLASALAAIPQMRGNLISFVILLFLTQAHALAQKNPFTVRSYLGQCLSVGTLPGVYVAACNRQVERPHIESPAALCALCLDLNQTIAIEEINTNHEVRLWVGNSVIGVADNTLVDGAMLQLQAPATATPGTQAQTFALDGDSIIVAANRALVLKVQNARGANLTPVVLSSRKLDSAEFWDFESTNPSTLFPTTGFVTVSDEASLRGALANATKNSVIVIDPRASILLSQTDDKSTLLPISIQQDEVTVRGGRRGVGRAGAQLTVCQLSTVPDCKLPLEVFPITANYVRMTGLRVKGPSQTRDKFANQSDVIVGLNVTDTFPPNNTVYVDHNELYGWTGAAVQVETSNGSLWDCTTQLKRSVANVHVVANYLHHNQRDDEGYGVGVRQSGYAEIRGNFFSKSRHAISADGSSSSGYVATGNLVRDSTQQDFDMHGSVQDDEGNSNGGQHNGGIGGGQVEISGNTFLLVNDFAFESRGWACAQETFAANVVVDKGAAQAVQWYQPKNFSKPSCVREQQSPPATTHDPSCGDMLTPPNTPPQWLTLPENGQFGLSNPADRLGVGDFDGDGHDDLFLATGASWYYSPAGVKEWRFLASHTEKLSELLFGDFDGDGRTDVVKKSGRQWFISWGGISDWELLNNLDTSNDDISHYTVGHFVSPKNTDLFHATGTAWLLSSGGRGSFDYLNKSSYGIPDLRFGDFDGDGKTDVFGYEGGRWRITSAGAGDWSPKPLNNSQLSTSVNGLVVGDFDGDGVPDIAQGGQFSSGGQGPWQPLGNVDVSKAIAPPAYFSAIPNVQVAVLTDSKIRIAYEGCCEIR